MGDFGRIVRFDGERCRSGNQTFCRKMKLKWLKQSIDDESDRKLIFFFGGWGLGDQVVEHLMFDEFDVLFLNDYRNLSFYFSKS